MKVKRVILLLVVCVSLMLMPILAGAQEPNYISVRGGIGWTPDVDRTAGNRTATVEFGSTYGLGAAYGRRVASWLRLEGEFSYLEAKVDEIKGHFGQETIESGQDRFYALMVNALADLKNDTDLTPFAGFGLGPVYAHHDLAFSPFPDMPAVDSDHLDWVFGYQLMAAVGWEIKPRLSLDACQGKHE